MRRDDPTRFEGQPTDGYATRSEGQLAGPDTIRFDGADPEATRQDGSASPRQGWSWFGQLPAGVLAQYEFVRPLSTSGGQADVHLCRDRTSGRDVAIKVYRGRPSIDLSTYERLRRIPAEHVTPTVLHVDSDAIWEEQEFFPLGSLLELVRRRGGAKQPAVWIREVVREIALALQSVHNEAITHRDLKPGNVFVRDTDPLDLVLGDFGLARDLTMSAEYMTVAGSFRYSAPEVLSAAEVSPAADWWSLGVMVFELLTGHSLSIDENGAPQRNEHRVRADIVKGHYSLAEVTDGRWSLLLRGLLNRSRKHRWTETQVLAWCSGASPEVIEVPDQLEKTPLAPIALPWGEFSDPAEAVRCLAGHWSDARSYLSGQGAVHLMAWLRQTPARDGATAVLQAVHDRRMPADSALVVLQILLDPGRPVTFQGRTVDAPTLAEVARRAAGRDEAAQDWIRALRRNQVLGAMATNGRGGPSLAAADMRLKLDGDRLDAVVKQAQNDRTLTGFVTAFEGPAEGTVLAAALDGSLRQQHVASARAAATRLTDADSPLLRQWAARVKDQGAAALPEALALASIGTLAVEARIARDKAAHEAEGRERRAARARQIREQLRSALRAARTRLILAALVPTIMLVTGSQSSEYFVTLAIDFGLPLLLSIGIAFAADALLPAQRRQRASYVVGMAVLLWVVLWAIPLPVPGFGAWILGLPAVKAPWFASGYALGHLVGASLDRLQGQGGASVLWRYRLVPWLATAAVAVLSAMEKFGIPPTALGASSTYFQLARALDPFRSAVPWSTMNPLSLGIAALALMAVTFANATRSLGRRRQRTLWAVLNVAALVVLAYLLPELVAGWMLGLLFFMLAAGVAIWAGWAAEL